MRGVLPHLALIAAVCATFGCSTDPQTAQGSRVDPKWAAAEEAFQAEDYAAVHQTLTRIEEAGGANAPRAAAWHMVLLAAQARAFYELAEAYGKGAEATHHQVLSFQIGAGNYRSQARIAILELAEMATRADRYLGTDGAIALRFPLPQAADARSSVIANISLGRAVGEAGSDKAMSYALRRAFVRTAGETAGCAEDFSEVQSKFSANSVQTSRLVFLAAIGRVLYEQAELFAADRLNDTNKRDLLFDLSDGLLTLAVEQQCEERERLDDWRVQLSRRRETP